MFSEERALEKQSEWVWEQKALEREKTIEIVATHGVRTLLVQASFVIYLAALEIIRQSPHTEL